MSDKKADALQVSENSCPVDDASAELRRLHAENQELLEALREFVAYRDRKPGAPYRDPKSWLDRAYKKASAAIAKVEGENHESL